MARLRPVLSDKRNCLFNPKLEQAPTRNFQWSLTAKTLSVLARMGWDAPAFTHSASTSRHCLPGQHRPQARPMADQVGGLGRQPVARPPGHRSSLPPLSRAPPCHDHHPPTLQLHIKASVLIPVHLEVLFPS